MTTRDIAYANAHERQKGDLFLPENVTAAPPVLLIHGGGWNAMAKEAMEPLVPLFTGDGRAVFSINYRLLDHSPWPACADDCMAAGLFMLEGGLAERGLRAAEKVLICGGSAGGHLAMIAGLGLGGEKVEAIISLAGPSRVDPGEPSSDSILFSPNFLARFFGRTPTAELLTAANPIAGVKPDSPPLFCVHSRNDRLVLLSHSEQAVASWQRAGIRAELLPFDGPGDSHGFWDSDDLAARQPIPAVVTALREILRRLHSPK